MDDAEKEQSNWKLYMQLGNENSYGIIRIYNCAACGKIAFEKSKFCPECGRQMKEIGGDNLGVGQ